MLDPSAIPARMIQVGRSGSEGCPRRRRLQRSFQSKNVLHIIETRRLMLRPFDGAKGAFCESFPTRSLVREFDPLARAGVNDRMLTDDITATQGMHSDLCASPLTDHSGASVTGVPLVAQASNLRENLGKALGRSARRRLAFGGDAFQQPPNRNPSREFPRSCGQARRGY